MTETGSGKTRGSSCASASKYAAAWGEGRGVSD